MTFWATRIHCQLCSSKVAEHKHHKFSQTKHNRKIYGKLLDEQFNILYLCSDCYLNKTIPKYNELQFRIEADKLDFTLPAPSKSFKTKIKELEEN